MKKIIKTTALTLLSSLILTNTGPTVFANQTTDPKIKESANHQKTISISDLDGNLTTPKPNKQMLEKATILENYFYVKPDGNVGLNGDARELANVLNISEEDASLYFKAVNDLPNTYLKGPVGIRFNLGPTVRGMTGWAAGTFAAGYAGWHLKQLALNPTTAGLVAVISGAIGWTVKNAVENHKTTTLAVVYIPGVNLVYTVNVP